MLSLAAATAAWTPALASGGYGPPHLRHHDYRPHHDGRHYDRHWRRDRGRLSGAEAALIAAGIIGGVILIDRALDRRDERSVRDDCYDPYYDDADGCRSGAFGGDFFYRRDDRPYDRFAEAGAEDDLDERLLGDDGEDAWVAEAFRECAAETRGAAGAGGLSVALPSQPESVDTLPDGAVRLTAQFRAFNARGGAWPRRFVCEADAFGIRFLQID